MNPVSQYIETFFFLKKKKKKKNNKNSASGKKVLKIIQYKFEHWINKASSVRIRYIMYISLIKMCKENFLTWSGYFHA